METITSRTNPLCTILRKLASSGSYRRERREFLCDSPKLLEEALAYGGSLQTVVCTEQTALPFVPAGVRLVAVPGDVMKSISPAQTAPGCALRVQNAGKRPCRSVSRADAMWSWTASGPRQRGDDPPHRRMPLARTGCFGKRLRRPL